jgi:hypothetical protein
MLTLNNELEGTWKEAVVVKFEVMLWHMPEGPEENQIKVTNVTAETRIVFYRKKNQSSTALLNLPAFFCVITLVSSLFLKGKVNRYSDNWKGLPGCSG